MEGAVKKDFAYADLARDVAPDYGLDPDLVIALCMVESSGNPYAWNPEPSYRYYWDVKRNAPFRAVSDHERAAEFPPADFPCLVGDPDQEWWAQAASWGLMQVMGAVAREQGFFGPYLTELCDPRVNLCHGCTALKGHLTWAKGDVRVALAAYNAGRGGAHSPVGQKYADKILALVEAA